MSVYLRTVLFMMLLIQGAVSDEFEVLTMPQAIKANILDSDREILQFYKVIPLSEEKLLVLSTVKDYEGIHHDSFPIPIIPFIIDTQGNWIVPIPNYWMDIAKINFDTHLGVWVEDIIGRGEYDSAMYYSKEGYVWHRVRYPEHIQYGDVFYPDVKQCFVGDKVRLTFGNLPPEFGSETWIADINTVTTQNPNWKRVSNLDMARQTCLSFASGTHWKDVYQKENIVYIDNSLSKIRIQFPLYLTKSKEVLNSQFYYVQVGVYKDKKYEEIMLKHLENRLFPILKERVSINGEAYTKILIGGFFRQDKAEAFLTILKSDKQFKNAFLVERKGLPTIEN